MFRLAMVGALLGGCDSSFGLVHVTPLDTPGLASYVAEVVADMPVGYYRMGGATAVDQVAGGAAGSLLGAVMLEQPGALAGDPDLAMGFNGVDSAVDVGHAYDFPGNQAFSIECWIDPAATSTTGRAIVSRWAAPPQYHGYLLYQDGGSALTFQRTDVTGTFADSASITNLMIGVYSHVVATYDGHMMLVYINSAPVAVATSTAALSDLPLEFMIGAGNDDPTLDTFDGLIDEVAIYNAALPPERIAAHYLAGTTAP